MSGFPRPAPGALLAINNLSDVANKATAKTNLGVPTLLNLAATTVLAQVTMIDRLDINGATVGGDGTLLATLLGYSQFSTPFNDMVILAGPNASDVHISRQVGGTGILSIDLPSSDFKLAGKIIGAGANLDLVEQLGGAAATKRVKNHLGSDLFRLTDAGAAGFDDGSGTFALVFQGNAAFGTIAGGGSSDILVYYSTQGSGHFGKHRFRDNSVQNTDVFYVDTAAPTSGNTNMALTRHNGTAAAFVLVTIGAVDSGGAGFRSLRVPN